MLGMVGLIEDAERTMTQWFKQEGDVVILLGSTREDLGGSEYIKVVHAREQGSPPYLSLDTEQALHGCVLSLIHDGLLQSAHDCSEGGVAVALAESCISGSERTLGAVVTLTRGRLRKDAVLFGESQSRVVVSAKPVHREAILDHARRFGVPVEVIGTVSGDRLIVSVGDERSMEQVIHQPVAVLLDRWAFSVERSLSQA
jgi:phosphoribosylformylglycinamidine synthase